MKLRHRAYLLGLAPAILLAMILAIHHGLARHRELEDRLRQHGQDMTRHLAMAAEFWVVSGDVHALDHLLRQTLRDPQVLSVTLRDLTGRPLSQARREATPSLFSRLASDSLDFHAPVVLQPLDQAENPFFAGDPPEPARTLAHIELSLSRADLVRLQTRMLGVNLVILLVGALLAWLLAHRLSGATIRPLMDIADAVRRIAGGDFHPRLEVNASHELRDIQEGVNRMSDALRTYQEEMEARIRQATTELARQKEIAESANQSKSRFLAAASHDLRQPMHAITLFVASLKRHELPPAARPTLEKIEAATTQMETMFTSILDVTKLEAGVIVPRREVFDIGDALTRLANDFEAEAVDKSLRLRTRIAHVTVVSDRILLDRILRNLLANALRYTERGGVLLALRRRGANLLVQVWDTGKGIGEQDREHIFEEYYQAENPHRSPGAGLGLGLYIVRRLCQLLDHPLRVHSRPGRGSVFSIEIPLSSHAAPTPDKEDERAMQAGMPTGRVLVVDDDATVRDALATLLRSWGLEACLAGSSSEALAALTPPPDMLLLDYHLNGEDGLTLARTIQARLHDLPITLVTGATAPDTLAKLQASGLHVMYKPVKPARLRAHLQSVLSRRDAAG